MTLKLDCPYWPRCQHSCWTWAGMREHIRLRHPLPWPRCVTEAETDERRERLKKCEFE